MQEVMDNMGLEERIMDPWKKEVKELEKKVILVKLAKFTKKKCLQTRESGGGTPFQESTLGEPT